MRKIKEWFFNFIMWIGTKLANERFEKMGAEIMQLKNEAEAKEAAQTSRIRFELRADLPTKIRVWWRENKAAKNFIELESELTAIEDEIKTARNELEEMRPKSEGAATPQFMDFTPKVSHQGLSRTAR